MSQYDVYLGGQGFMLAKDSAGQIAPGAHREQVVDPFTLHLSRDEPYQRIPFGFEEGGGLAEYDGSARYEWGRGVDTRSGKAMPLPARTWLEEAHEDYPVIQDGLLWHQYVDKAHNEGIAQRYQAYLGCAKIRSVSILVRRSTARDYAGTTDPTIEIWSDSPTEPKPNAQLASLSFSLIRESDPFWPMADRWRNGEWFWLECVFSADVTVGYNAYFWVAVLNSNDYDALYLGENLYEGGVTRAYYNSSAWADGIADSDPLYIKFNYTDKPEQPVDSHVRCFQTFRGSDGVERIYAGTAYRIITRAATTPNNDPWEVSKDVQKPCTQLLEFNSKLFAACGPDTDLWYTTGASASTVWAQVSGQQAGAFAIYDNMLWKADGCTVTASEDGTTWTATTVDVGDPGTVVTALTAHGGKLFAAKPEGVYEISYPDTYPTSGDPTCNLMLDFRTERGPKTWLVDWHSGLYFPGLGGIYELKFDVLRNLWASKVDENAMTEQENYDTGYTRPRAWAALYDRGPATWSAMHGTTRGAVFARSNPHILKNPQEGGACELIWFNNDNWYSLCESGNYSDTDGGFYDNYGEYILAVFLQDMGGGRGILWYGSGINIVGLDWPTWTEDTYDAGDIEYCRYAQFTTPWYSLAERSKEFLLCKVGISARNIQDSDSYIGIGYRCDDDTGYTGFLNFNYDECPYAERTFTAGTTARRVQFSFRIVCGPSGGGEEDPPMLEQVDLFIQPLTEQTRTFQVIVSAMPNEELREGGVDERTAGEIVTALRGMVGNESLAFVDNFGGSHTVRITAMTVQTQTLDAAPGALSASPGAQVILNLLVL